MKSLLPLFSLALSLTSAHAATDDFIIQTRVDQPSMSWIVDKTRLLMGNEQINDDSVGTVSISDINLPLNQLLTQLLPPPAKGTKPKTPNFDVNTLQGELNTLWKLDLKSATLRIRVPSVSYAVGKIDLAPKRANVTDPALDLNTDVMIDSLNVSLDQGIQVDVMFINPANKQLESYFTASLDPTSFVVAKPAPPIRFNVDFTVQHDERFRFSLKNQDLSAVDKYLAASPSAIQILASAAQKPISADQIKVNPVIVKLNANLSRSISFDAFRPLVQAALPSLTHTLLTNVGAAVQTSIGPNILQNLFTVTAPDAFNVNEDGIYAGFNTDLFTQPDPQQFALEASGDLCTSTLYNQYKQLCPAHNTPFNPPRVISADDQQKAKDEIKTILASGQQDVAISISEDYINRLLKTIIDAKVFDDVLKSNNLSLGPKGLFVLFDHETQNPQIYLDLVYSGEKGLQSLFINAKHPLHFPLRFESSIMFNLDKNGTPALAIKTGKLLSTQDEIIKGIPNLGLQSKLIPLIRKKVASIILNMANTYENHALPSLSLPIFTGLGLEKTSYTASQYGRLNIYFKM